MTRECDRKQPDGDISTLLSLPFAGTATEFAGASADHRFAAAVAAFGMLLRYSDCKGDATFDHDLLLAGEIDMRPEDRAEFVSLVKIAKRLSGSLAARQQ